VNIANAINTPAVAKARVAASGLMRRSGDESVGYSPVSERQAERDSPQKGTVIDLPERILEVSRNKGQQTQEIFWGTYILLFIAPYSAFVGQVPQSLLFFLLDSRRTG